MADIMSTANLTAKQRMEGKRAIMARILGMKDVGIKHYSFGMILNVFRAYYSLGEVSRLARAHERERGFLYTHVISARPDVAVLSPVRFRPMARACASCALSMLDRTCWCLAATRSYAATAARCSSLSSRRSASVQSADGSVRKGFG